MRVGSVTTPGVEDAGMAIVSFGCYMTGLYYWFLVVWLIFKENRRNRISKGLITAELNCSRIKGS